MSLADALRRVVEALDQAGIPYMLTGSVAGTAHGLSRATQDVDIVIDPSSATLDRFVGSLDPAAYYVDLDAARDALARRSMFNVIDLASGWKIDCIVRKERPFSREELARRRPAAIAGVTVMVASPEDVIVSKLEWAQMSASERQLEDVAGIVAVAGDGLDRAYLEKWIAILGLASAWARVPGR